MKLLIVTQGPKDIEIDVETRERIDVSRDETLSTLKRFQGYVGGLVECVGLGAMTGDPSLDDIDLVLNEEGKVNGLDQSLVLFNPDGAVTDTIAGNAIFCTADEEGNWVGLDDDRVEALIAAIKFTRAAFGRPSFGPSSIRPVAVIRAAS